MAHLDFVRPSGQWKKEMVPGAGDYYRYDVNQSKGIDGDHGGSYAPKSPIIVGGAGVQLTTASSIVGGVTTKTGGRAVIGAADNTFPTLGPGTGRTRTIQIPIMASVFVDPNGGGGSFTRVFNDASGCGIMGTGVGTYPLYFEIPPRYLHSGARLATLGINFRVTQRPSALPSTPFSLFAASKSVTGVFSAFNPSLVGQWVASTAETAGTYITASSPTTNKGYYYKAQNNGTTGAIGNEPNWPTVIGNTVVDNTITWVCTGRVGWYPLFGATVDSYFSNGQVQTIQYDYDGLSGPYGSNVIDTTQQRYQIAVENLDPTVLITSAFAVFDTINSLAFG
jgi:hypothetical protein